MKILRLLNKLFFQAIFFSLLSLIAYAEDQPVDIWNIDKKKIEGFSSSNDTALENENKATSQSVSDIYNLQSQKKINTIKLDETLETKKINIYGLYDPEDYDLDIDMWSNSNGDELRNIFTRLAKIDLSKDALEIMKIALLTNAHIPQINISEKEFLDIRSKWLIKNSDLALIEEYLIKNQIIDLHPKLTKYLLDQYLSEAEIDKACNFLSKYLKPLKDEYLTKFNIYCLIKSDKKDQALLIYDLKKELGFSDKYFEKKIDYLFGYNLEIDKSISEKSVFDFHLAHITNPDFIFEPNKKTSKIIWKYLSSSNLLKSFDQIEISELDKISTIEKAVHDKNYPEKDLFEIYKRFQFNINQLLTAETSHKSLSKIEGRALMYQRILLESEITKKLNLLKLLKNSFKIDNLNYAFDIELK